MLIQFVLWKIEFIFVIFDLQIISTVLVEEAEVQQVLAVEDTLASDNRSTDKKEEVRAGKVEEVARTAEEDLGGREEHLWEA